MVQQRTLAKSFTVEGVGLHTGQPVTVSAYPADALTGIVFCRTDRDAKPTVRVRPEAVVPFAQSKGRQTGLICGDAVIHTVEHLLAALHACGIDNARIDIDNDELPALDGSARMYVEAIRNCGTVDQGVERQYYEVTEPVSLEVGGNSIVVTPADSFKVSYTLSYGHPSLSDQFVSFTVDEETFCNEIAPARTFCLKEEAEALQAAGYGKGATCQNTLVFENNMPIDNELRFADEAARHKVLDLIGDIYLLGQPIKGHVITSKTGHHQNFELVRKLTEMKENTEKDTLDEIRNARQLDINQIKKILPHRYPFLLVDRVLDLEPGKRIVAIKNVTANEEFFLGHFQGHPIMPGVLIIEAMAQAGGIVTMLNEENPEDKVAYFMSIDKAKFRAPVIPGDQLRFEVEVIKSKGPIGVCAGKAYVGDKLVSQAEIKFTIMDK